jgi:hypothetical protein
VHMDEIEKLKKELADLKQKYEILVMTLEGIKLTSTNVLNETKFENT